MLQFPFRGLLGGQEALVSRLRCWPFGPKGAIARTASLIETLEVRKFMRNEPPCPAISSLNAPLFALFTKKASLFFPILGISAAFGAWRNVGSRHSLQRVREPPGRPDATMANCLVTTFWSTCD